MLWLKSFCGASFAFLAVAASTVSVRAADAEAPKPWPPDPFLPLTLERINSLPASEQPEWKNYLKTSEETAELRAVSVQPDVSPTNIVPVASRGALHSRGLILSEPEIWQTQPGPTILADRVVANQSAAGGWTKGIDYTQPPKPASTSRDAWSNGTFDNNATITELRYLASVITKFNRATNVNALRASFDRGLQYIFKSQYPNGGFPQIYPLAGGYHDNVTYNDGAMERILQLLGDVASGRNQFSFVSRSVREEAARRFQLGINCILASQIKTADGRLTVWCQQHDALTLKPAAARNFEPIGASAGESAGIAKILMSLPDPSPEVVASVDAAMDWFRVTPIHNITYDRFTNGGFVVHTPGAPPLWARLYELETNRPIFGDRDRTIHYDLTAVSAERRRGYAWYGQWPVEALQTYESWKTNRKLSTPQPPTAPHSP